MNADEFILKWSHLWGGEVGEQAVGPVNPEDDIRQMESDAYDTGFEDGENTCAYHRLDKRWKDPFLTDSGKLDGRAEEGITH